MEVTAVTIHNLKKEE